MINKEDLLNTCSPMLVTSNDEETDEEFENRWNKFDSLSENIKETLSSMDTVNVIAALVDSHNLSPKDAAEVSRIIRSYFFGEIPLNFIDKKLAEKISGLDDASLKKIFQVIKDKIFFSANRENNSAMPNKIVSISLHQAIQIYPNLGEQVITSNSIHLKIFPQPVRPSIKNWIEDYRSVMGAERHGMMERGNYLFHTENTKRLTSGERKKLAEILRSLDEDVTLKVDPDRQEIIFEQAEEMKPVEKLANYQNNSLSSPSAGGVWDKKENVQNIPRSNFQASKQQIPNYFQFNPLLKGDDGMRASQNTPNQNFRSSNEAPNANVRFSSPQTFSSEKKPEPARTSFQQPSNYSGRDSRINTIPQSDRKTGYTNPRAGKPWEPASPKLQRSEPKVNGNIVDLRN